MINLKQCIVINIEEGSERFSRIHLFSEDEGIIMALKRKSTKRSGMQHLDLFQTAEIVFDQKPSQDISFVKETHILTEREAIGKSYTTFAQASRFCRVVQLNARHMENPQSVFETLKQALDAWNQKPYPYTTFFKALYRLASEEGFPVRQIWLERMNKKERISASSILKQPLETIPFPDENSKVLAENLTNWLTHQQDFLF